MGTISCSSNSKGKSLCYFFDILKRQGQITDTEHGKGQTAHTHALLPVELLAQQTNVRCRIGAFGQRVD